MTENNWKKVIVWGAALSGESCMSQLQERGIEVMFFVDKYPPEGSEFLGKKVVQSDDFLTMASGFSDCDAIILTMGAGATDIKKLIEQNGFTNAVVTFRLGTPIDETLNATKRILPYQLFSNASEEFKAELLANIERWLSEQAQELIIYGYGSFTQALLAQCKSPNILEARCWDDNPNTVDTHDNVFSPDTLCDFNTNNSYFIGCTHYLDFIDIKNKLIKRGAKHVFGVEDVLSQCFEGLSQDIRVNPEYSIYPINIPQIEIKDNLDMLLLDLPARMLGMLPNGLGYVNNILKREGIDFQTLDLDMIYYHRYHSSRILDGLEQVVAPNGRVLENDPWAIASIEGSWQDPEFVALFHEQLDEFVDKLEIAAPKLLGISISATSNLMAKYVVQSLRQRQSDIKVIVGGYDCISPIVGPKLFPDFDYMVIFEAESSLGPLVRKILNNETVYNLPGVIANNQNIIGFQFDAAELVDDLDSLGYPRYEWTDIRLYKNYNGYQLVPILLSRGCKWSKCTFCGERFSWRRRSVESVVDEIEWLVSQGCNNFHFNDSDLSGDPEAVRGICQEIVNRGIKNISLVGQLRVQKGYTKEYFEVLYKAGFKYLRYGIDGWSRNTLRLHKKGYNAKLIKEVLAMTKASGMLVAINLVLGIPHETEEDIDETIFNMLDCKGLYDTIENINVLHLISGSVYWEDPERFGIRFKGDFEELKQTQPQMISSEHWYSVEPYIDQRVRMDRLNRIIEVANENGVRIGSYAEWKAKWAEYM